MFLSSFYCYLNYHPTNDFIIDLDNVWEWMGYNQKVKAKGLLEKSFVIDIDYKHSLSQLGKRTPPVKGPTPQKMQKSLRPLYANVL